MTLGLNINSFVSFHQSLFNLSASPIKANMSLQIVGMSYVTTGHLAILEPMDLIVLFCALVDIIIIVSKPMISEDRLYFSYQDSHYM